MGILGEEGSVGDNRDDPPHQLQQRSQLRQRN
jgi:hypothetical protein